MKYARIDCETGTIPGAEFIDKVRGCWMGKGIGGNAGMPYEGDPNPLGLTRLAAPATQVPNDDLEMQLLWLVLAEKHGVSLRARHLAKGRVSYEAYPDEYGIALWNQERGLTPPVTGLHNNWFGDGMGAAIRSEIWACLFPAQPGLAAAFAREDAIVDHHGDGVWGEVFLAAAESAAFAARTPEQALREGLKHIPVGCRVARAVNFALRLKRERATPLELRAQIMRRFGSHNFTDVAMNLAFIVMALVRGHGDFARTILTAVNCGMDTDCTGATCGAFLGILKGYRGIPAVHRKAAGQELVVSRCLRHLPLPKSVDEATERVAALSARMRAGLGGGKLPDPTPDVAADPVHDRNEWLIFRSPSEAGYECEPRPVMDAALHPERFRRYLHRAPGIHVNLAPFVKTGGDTLYLLTWITVPEKLDGQLMVCADTGLTVWLDGRQILNYHGRQKALPAFHRVEGGGVIPVRLQPGKPYALKIRLLGCKAPLGLTVALGYASGRYATVRFGAH